MFVSHFKPNKEIGQLSYAFEMNFRWGILAAAALDIFLIHDDDDGGGRGGLQINGKGILGILH